MLLFKPVITEKSLLDQENGRYHFMVNPDANKHQIREAFATIFKVKPICVNTLINKRKTRMDAKRHRQVDKGLEKKVIITVAKDTKINLLNTDSKKK